MPDFIDFTEKINRIAELARNCHKTALSQAEEHAYALPVPPENLRCGPNIILRSALFGVNRCRRPWHDGKERVPSPANVCLFCRPCPLDQTDLDVWLEAIHRAGRAPPGEMVALPYRRVLPALHRHYGHRQRWSFLDSLRRLERTIIRIETDDGGVIYDGRLIDVLRDDCGDSPWVALNPELPRLWTNGWGGIDPEVRRQLGRNQMARWLYGFYATHHQAYPYKVSTIHQLCGSTDRQLKKFRYNLRRALVALEGVTGWLWRIDNHDRVLVCRSEFSTATG